MAHEDSLWKGRNNASAKYQINLQGQHPGFFFNLSVESQFTVFHCQRSITRESKRVNITE